MTIGAGRANLALVLVGLVAVGAEPAEAGAWTLGRGKLTLKGGVAYWQADRKFASTLDRQLMFPGRKPVETGDRIPFDPVTAGRFRIASLDSGLRVGVLEWLDLGLDVPLLSADFDTSPADTVDARLGLGDVRSSLQARVLGGESYAIAARLEWKAPTGRFDPSVYAAPLSEGQSDVTVMGSAGVSLHPHGYANVELGYRFRMQNERNLRDPGDEVLGLIEGGLALPGGILLKLALDALVGRAGVDRFASRTPLPRRRFYSGWLALLWHPSDRWLVEASARLPIAGEDYPTGLALFTSVTYAIRFIDRR